MKFKEYLKGRLSDYEISLVKKSFDVVGDIAIIEVPDELINKCEIIGEAVCATNKNIKTVLRKRGIHTGPFRTQKLDFVFGEPKKETVYRENGIRLLLNPEEVYFSPRLSTERQRLLQGLFPKRVLVMFSGVGPYSLVAYNYQPNHRRIVSIELNPVAHHYALRNIELNRSIGRRTFLFKRIKNLAEKFGLKVTDRWIIERVNFLKMIFMNGDVKDVVRNLSLRKVASTEHNSSLFIGDLGVGKVVRGEVVEIDELSDVNLLKFFFLCQENCFVYKEYFFGTAFEKSCLIDLFLGFELEGVNKFDEIFMPLPKDASLFLNEAFAVAESEAVVHMYDFVHESEIPHLTISRIKEAALNSGVDIDILDVRKVGQYSPRKYRVCCDFIVCKKKEC